MILNEEIIPSFHAHIYYDMNVKHIASALRNDFLEVMCLPTDGKYSPLCEIYSELMHVGDMHDKPVGPHTKAMFRVAFKGRMLRLILNHLMLNNRGLSILFHPETGNDLKDHTESATWIGSPVALDLTKL